MAATAARPMRERAILAALGVTALYAVLAFLWTGSARETWEKSRKARETAQKTLEREDRLIAKRDWWKSQLASESSKMPRFPENQSVDTWLWPRLDAIAAGCNVLVHDRVTKPEEEKGDVFERELETHNAESSLKSLVRFMCALETAPGAMFDIREISINPNQKTGYLKTTLRIGCAYMRGDEEDASEEVEEEEEENGRLGRLEEQEEVEGEEVELLGERAPSALTATPNALEASSPKAADPQPPNPVSRSHRGRRADKPHARRRQKEESQ